MLDAPVSACELLHPGTDERGDNPPIGIVLCGDKSDAIAKYTLPENNNQIFASKYFTYLPTEDELKRKLRLDDFQKVE